MTSPAGATVGNGEARLTSVTDHGTGRGPRNARHPPPPARNGRDGAASLLAFFGNARSRPRACLLPWLLGPGFAQRGPLPRTACATFGAVSLTLDRRNPAHPPRTGDTPIQQRHRSVRGSRAKPGARADKRPPEIPTSSGGGSEPASFLGLRSTRMPRDGSDTPSGSGNAIYLNERTIGHSFLGVFHEFYITDFNPNIEESSK